MDQHTYFSEKTMFKSVDRTQLAVVVLGGVTGLVINGGFLMFAMAVVSQGAR